MAYRPVRIDFTPPVHELAAFRKHPGSNIWSADMSSLSEGGTKQVFGAIWKNTLDTGLAIKSPKTGRVEAFMIYGHDMSGGDIAGWKLRPLRSDLDMELLVVNT